MIIALPVPATVVVVISEPRGLGNPITMGIKTSKAYLGMERISGEVAAATKHGTVANLRVQE